MVFIGFLEFSEIFSHIFAMVKLNKQLVNNATQMYLISDKKKYQASDKKFRYFLLFSR